MKKLYFSLKKKLLTAAAALTLGASAFAQTDVLVCGAASPQSWLDDVQNKLIATGAFSSVTTYNTYTTGTPSLAYLQTFDAVLVYTDYPCIDPVTFGNNLAQYIDGGGGVVSSTFANASVLITGNFNTATYQVCIPNNGQLSSPTLTLGTIYPACNPIMSGISSFNGGSSSYRSSSNSFVPGTTLVADWSNGEWLVAARTNVGTSNARRADLNFYPPSSTVRSDFWDASTQGGQLMANALLWVAGATSGTAPGTPGSITGNGAVCAGSSDSYSISPVSGATSYTWTVPSGTTITSGQGTTSITTSAGSTSGNITVTADNACGSSTASSFSLTINALPVVSVSANNTTICDGDTAALTASGASTYAWSSGGTSATENVSPSLTATYTVTGTDANGCSDAETITINVNALPNVSAMSTPGTICAGDTAEIMGMGASIYMWNTGAGTAVDSVMPASTTTYTVTGTDANGCMNTATTTVNVNALPVVSATASSPAICTGDTTTLTASGASTYAWSSGGSTDTENVSPASSTTYTVTGTDINGCMNTATVMVTVNALPAVGISGFASICIGDSATLTASGASSYAWSTGGMNATETVSPASMTTYIVTGTDSNGCINSDSITISVNALPDVSATASESIICMGDTTTLSASGASTYTWSSGGSTDTEIVSPSSTMTYTVTGTDINGCMDTTTVTVTVNPLPVVTASAASTVVCVDDGAVALTGSPVGGTWLGSGVTGSSFDPGVGIGAQTLTYMFNDTNGCTGSAEVVIQVNACVTVAEHTLSNGVNVYPNPNDGAFTLSIDVNVSDLSVTLLDMEGRVILSRTMSSVAAGHNEQIMLDDVAAGIYTLRLSTQQEQHVRKIAVKK